MTLNFFLKLRTGFTIIEALISIAILTLIMLALGTMGARFLRLNTAITGATMNQESINQIITPLVVELRSMQLSNTGSFSIEAASTSSIIFYSDINKDGLVERIRYFLEGDIMKRGVVVPSGDPLVYNLSSETINNMLANMTPDPVGIFAYYGNAADIAGSALSFPLTTSSIKLIKIMLVVDQNPGQLPGPLRFITAVTPRTLRNN